MGSEMCIRDRLEGCCNYKQFSLFNLDCEILDCDGICNGSNQPDCNNACGGNAIIDDCGICTEGDTGFQYNINKDCEGVCFGTSVLDQYNNCCVVLFTRYLYCPVVLWFSGHQRHFQVLVQIYLCCGVKKRIPDLLFFNIFSRSFYSSNFKTSTKLCCLSVVLSWLYFKLL